MRPRDFALAIAGFISLITFAPLWVRMTTTTGMDPAPAWIAALTLPALAMLFVTSWVKPQMATPVMGLFVLAGFMAVVPTLWDLMGLGARIAPDGGLTEAALQAALPIIVIAFVMAIGWRRLQ